MAWLPPHKAGDMQIIGLTGSIATGKSVVAGMVRQMRFPVHDADAAVHRLMGPHGAAVANIVSLFGAQVGSPGTGIDRKILGNMVFSDSSRKAELEAILHPLVFQDRDWFIKQARRQRKPAVFLDVPLLFETGGDGACDHVITVWSPVFIQRQRALRRDGMTPQKLDAILAAQIPQPEKKRLSDLALPSSLGRAETCRRLKKWLISANLL